MEVLSGDVSLREVSAKVRDYLGAGAAQVWILDPDERTVTVHSQGGRSLTLGETDRLDGGEVLPGFEVDVRALFPA